MNTGTDYVAIFKSLAAYRTWLLRHDPDPGLVEHAYVPGTEAFDALSDDLSLLRNGRQRYIEDGQRFEVEVASDKSGVVSLRVREHIRANRIIDAQGQTVDEAPSGPVNDYIVLLAADPEGEVARGGCDSCTWRRGGAAVRWTMRYLAVLTVVQLVWALPATADLGGEGEIAPELEGGAVLSVGLVVAVPGDGGVYTGSGGPASPSPVRFVSFPVSEGEGSRSRICVRPMVWVSSMVSRRGGGCSSWRATTRSRVRRCRVRRCACRLRILRARRSRRRLLRRYLRASWRSGRAWGSPARRCM
ncbi:MAG: hypothetical protein M5T61_06755 [Acidimicrobiia bacterium]|nr:hypothetical protein [Acidimicrobiia bacterium]